MPILDTSIFKERAVILSEMLSALQDAVPQVYVGEDGVLRIIYEIEAGQLESAYLAAQLVLEDVFPQLASAPALKLHGDTFNLPFLTGDYAEGILKFSGSGGTDVPAGTQAGANPGGGLDPLVFTSTDDATIPNPGTPTAPTAAVSATAGVLTGTYEYAVTFVTEAGETLQSPDSNAVAPSSKKVDLTAIPLGGPGTLARRIYRQKDGIGDYLIVTQISDNTTTVMTDNNADGSVGPGTPPLISTAESIEVTAVATRPGTQYNVQAGTVIILTSGVVGVNAVINNAPFAGGTNQEDIESFRTRLMEYLRNPRTGSDVDLIFWAQQIEGVDSATVFDNDFLGSHVNGHVTVRIVGPDGTVPSTDVQNAVLTYLQTKDVANITIHVGVFDPVTLPISVAVTLADGYILDDVEQDVKEAVSHYIASVPINGTAYTSGVIDAIFGLPGIVDVTTTMTNTFSGATSKLVTGLDDVTVTVFP